MNHKPHEVLLPIFPKTDFQKNLFLKYQVRLLQDRKAELEAEVNELKEQLENQLGLKIERLETKIKNQAVTLTNQGNKLAQYKSVFGDITE